MSSTFKSSINEIFSDPIATKLLGDTKALQESKKLDEFFTILDECSNKVVYGDKEVYFALEEMAIKDLLISNNLLKSTNFGQRKKYMELVEEVKG